MAWVEIIEQTLERPLGLMRNDLESLSEVEQRKCLHSCLVREGLMPPQSTPDILHGSLRTFAASMRTNYTPERIYQGSVQLVLANNPKLDWGANLREQERIVKGWRRWAPNLVSVCASGTHMSILKPPHVHSLAGLILEVLYDVDRNDTKRLKGLARVLSAAGSD